MADIGDELGAEPIWETDVRGAAALHVEHARVEHELARWTERYLQRGVYVFRYHDSFGDGEALDTLLVLPTKDKYEVLKTVGTDGINYDLENDEIIRWLRRLEKTHPFLLTEANIEVVAGRFHEPVRDADALARRMYRFCPDIVDQGTGSVARLAQVLEDTQELYLWWD